MSAEPAHFDALFIGDPAPWFRQRCIGQDAAFSFDTAAGRFIALCFYGGASEPEARRALGMMQAHQGLFDGSRRCLFGVSGDPADEADKTLSPRAGVRHFADADGVVARAFGMAPRQGAPDLAVLRRGWLVLDPRLRLVAAFPLDEAGGRAAMRYLESLPPPALYFGEAPAPVLLVPHVFEPEFCARLVQAHQADGGEDSPVLTEGGAVRDHAFKSRTDWRIADQTLAAQVQARIFRRVVPEIRHAFQFEATRMERLVVACYDAEAGGRFGAHRDNTVAASAHRRFAVSLNLNDDFEGGGIVFPEYSGRAFRPAAGAALVFSCSLMHAVVPVTRGRRFACLPFLYDEAAADLRRGSSAARRPGGT